MIEACTDKVAADGSPPRGGLSLRANFLWSLAGNVTYAACQWGMLVVLAKLGSPELVGEFALALAVTAPVIIGASLCLRNVQATDARGDYTFGQYYSLRVFTTAAALLIIAAVALLGYGPHLAAVVCLVGLAKGIESVSDILYGYLQQREQMDRIAVSMIVKGPLSLAAVGLAIYGTGQLVLAAAGLALVWAAMLVAYDARVTAPLCGGAPTVRQILTPRWTPAILWKLALLALPGGIVMTLITFSNNVPRYFVEHHLGTRELGIYAALIYPLLAGSTIVGALGQSATPRLAQHYARGEYAPFRVLLGKLVLIGLALGGAAIAAIWVAGRPLLELLYRPEYGEYVPAFLWVGLAVGVGYSATFLAHGMTAARYFRAQIPVFAATLVATAIACWLLVPAHGLIGAGLAMVIATVVQAIGSGMVIAHALRWFGRQRS